MEKRPKIRAQASPWSNGVELLIMDGEAVGVSITMEAKPHGVVLDPTLRIGRTEAQVLMDDLWSVGFRPTEGSGSAGSLKATEAHLLDMRKIAFKNLGIDG